MTLSAGHLRLINLSRAEPLDTACNKCGDQPYKDSRVLLAREAQQLRSSVLNILPILPIVSLQQPMGWTYEPIGIVTAQTVTGTGIFSDMASAFTDLFGTQSGTYNAKLREGESLCKSQLRTQTLEVGGNGIVAVDIDYAEVGGQRAMLMVCMTGTAVKIADMPSAPENFFITTAKASGDTKRIRVIDDALKDPVYSA